MHFEIHNDQVGMQFHRLGNSLFGVLSFAANNPARAHDKNSLQRSAHGFAVFCNQNPSHRTSRQPSSPGSYPHKIKRKAVLKESSEHLRPSEQLNFLAPYDGTTLATKPRGHGISD